MDVTKSQGSRRLEAFAHQRIFFGASFLVGSLLILILRELGFGVFISGGAAVSVMLAYMAIGAKTQTILRSSTLGDNLYYLGFLFTLVSLSYTLYKFSADDAKFIDGVVSNFGIAMLTTLVGLAFRVMFNQEKDDPELYEEVVRKSLTDAAAETIGATDKIRADLQTMKISVIQSVEEGAKNSIERMSSFTENSAKELETRLSGFFNLLSIDMREFFENLQRRNSHAWKEIEDEIQLVRDSNARLAEESKKFITQISRLNTSLAKVAPIDEQLMTKLLIPIDSLSERLINCSSQTQLMISSFNDLANSSRDLKNTVTATADDLKSQLLGVLLEVTKTFSDLVVSTSSLERNLTAQSGSLSNSLLDGIDVATKQLDAMRSLFSEMNRFVADSGLALEQLEARIATVGKAFDGLESK